MDLIDRQAALKAIQDLYPTMPRINFGDNISNWQQKYRQYIECENVIRILPSAEAEPVRQTAEWIYGEKDGADGWYCSKCGFHIPWYYEYYGLNNINFIRDFHTCPHCDSKMMKYTGMDEVT